MRTLLIGFVIAFLDQLTKYQIRMDFALGESRNVIPGFMDLTYLRNTGAAWGVFGGQNTWLIVVSLVMLLVIVIFRKSFLTDNLEHRIAMGLMLGGIIGNLVDRVRLGWVTDFLDFYVGGHHWPSFNIADSAICVGVGLYVISSLWLAGHPLREGTQYEAGSDSGVTDQQA